MNSVLFAVLFINGVIAVPMLKEQLKKQKVLATSEKYGPCTNHEDCCEADFCDGGGYCSRCENCHFQSDAIDGQCPWNCPATCEDKPPQYPKCGLCSSQEMCDAMWDDGMAEEEAHLLPTCNDDSGRCPIVGACRNESFRYNDNLESFFTAWFEVNQELFLNVTDGNYPFPEASSLPGGGEAFCACFHNGIECVSDSDCYYPTEEDLDDLRSMPWSFHDWCLNGMKCSPDQCAWAEGLEEAIFGHLEDGGDGCTGHDECDDESFCYVGNCAPCEECHFHWDAIDGTCPEKCPVLCEDTPPQFPKCPICSNQEECDAMHDSGFQEEEENPWPECSDGTARCIPSDDCKASSYDFEARMEDFFIGWFRSNPNATEMPPLDQWPSGTDLDCYCQRTQVECIVDNECYTDKDAEALEEMPFTVEEWCSDAMKCSASDCEWAKWEPGQKSCHDFVSVKTNQLQKKFEQMKVQLAMKSQSKQRKISRAAVKLPKFFTHHQAH